MRRFARTSLGLLSLAMIAPITASAQDAPAGYQPAAAVQQTALYGLDGKPLPAAPAVAADPAAVPHQHTGRLCAKCAAKAAKAAQGMPPGTIVGCAHSKNGVCTACAAAMKMPGEWTMKVSTPPGEAPGRAVASSAPANRSGRDNMAVAYDGSMGDPAPVGVVQAGYSPNGPMPVSASVAPQGPAPGRAVAESTPGHDPYQVKSSGFPHPHILGHLFGWSGLGAERAEEKARRKAETHAMISYDANGNSSTPIDDLPASAVYGKKGR
jgi:hypothetical protein